MSENELGFDSEEAPKRVPAAEEFAVPVLEAGKEKRLEEPPPPPPPKELVPPLAVDDGTPNPVELLCTAGWLPKPKPS